MLAKHFTGTLLVAAFLSCQTARLHAQAGPAYVNVEPHHASTEFEGAGRGLGYFARGLGAGMRDAAEALKFIAEAQRICLENRDYAIRQHQELKRGYAETMAVNRQPLTTEQYERLAKVARPDALSPQQLAADGTIVWPAPLYDAAHATLRVSVERALSAAAVETDPVRANQLRRQIIAGCEALKASLRAQVSNLPASEFMSGFNFLESVLCELKHPSARIGGMQVAQH